MLSIRKSFILFGILTSVSIANACNVPVFRYALERWRVDPYRVTLFHNGPLSNDEKKIVDMLDAYDKGRKGFPQCLTLTLVDLSKPKAIEEDDLKLWKRQKSAKAPWVVVESPYVQLLDEDQDEPEFPPPLWSGSLSNKMIHQLLFSPARREIAKRILNGQTGVVVLLESGDKKKDDAAEKLLRQELAKMPKELKLPELTDDPADQLKETAPPLRIEFSILRLARDDSAEAGFVRILMHRDPSLAKLKSPLVFSIFGRGRSLDALADKGIDAENIKKDCQFLVGACSCEVKKQNPGFDVLIDVDWEAGLTGSWVKPPEPPPLTSLFPEPEPQKLSKRVPIWEKQWFRIAAISLGGALIVLLIGGTILIRRRM